MVIKEFFCGNCDCTCLLEETSELNGRLYCDWCYREKVKYDEEGET